MSDDKSLARAAIGALHAAFGEHEGRVVHVKGGWAEATFTATPEGGALCRAPFLRGEPVRALVRFSNGGGNPTAHDGDRGGRAAAARQLAHDPVHRHSCLSLARARRERALGAHAVDTRGR